MSIVIDLSVALSSELPCWWPGLEPFSATPTLSLEQVNVFSRNLHLEEHAGTHMDARCHVGDSQHRAYASPADDVPLDRLIGPARVLDVRHLRSERPGVSPEVDLRALERLERDEDPLAPGDILLIWTGWSDERYVPWPAGDAYCQGPIDRRMPAWPAPTPSFVEALADREVRVLGVDTPTMGALPDPIPTHEAAFRRGVTPIENLINIGQVFGRTATFIFLPLSIKGSSGSPGRAVALLEQS